MDDCVFCKIIKGEIPSKKEYEDEYVFAFDDLHPVAPVHILVVPKKHIGNLAASAEEDGEILGKCQLAAVKIAKKKGIKDAFRFLTASGKPAGQSVMHLHYHLVGAWKKSAPPWGMEADPGGLRK